LCGAKAQFASEPLLLKTGSSFLFRQAVELLERWMAQFQGL